MKTNNDKCKNGKCLPKTIPNIQNQEPKPLDFKVVKPFIQFGKEKIFDWY